MVTTTEVILTNFVLFFKKSKYQGYIEAQWK